MKTGRHSVLQAFVISPRAYEFGRHERHAHYYYLGVKGDRCAGCGKRRDPYRWEHAVAGR